MRLGNIKFTCILVQFFNVFKQALWHFLCTLQEFWVQVVQHSGSFDPKTFKLPGRSSPAWLSSQTSSDEAIQRQLTATVSTEFYTKVSFKVIYQISRNLHFFLSMFSLMEKNVSLRNEKKSYLTRKSRVCLGKLGHTGEMAPIILSPQLCIRLANQATV